MHTGLEQVNWHECRHCENEKWNTKNEKQKTKNEKWKTKKEKQKIINKKWKMKNKKQKTKNEKWKMKNKTIYLGTHLSDKYLPGHLESRWSQPWISWLSIYRGCWGSPACTWQGSCACPSSLPGQ